MIAPLERARPSSPAMARSATTAARSTTPRTTCGFVLDLAARAVAEHVPPLDAARETDLGRFADLADRERIVGNLHRACAELRGAPPGGPIDLAPAHHRHGRLQRRPPPVLPGLMTHHDLAPVLLGFP